MQLELRIPIVVQKEVDGVEMGVLADGTPFLSGRGLAKLCGVANSTIFERTAEWESGQRDGRLAKHLLKQNFNRPSLYLPIMQKGTRVYAYDDVTSLLILDYYAYELENEIAKKNHRALALAGMRTYVYLKTGYDPTRAVPAVWQKFHDRLALNVVPLGYFSVFREMADVVLVAIRAGFPIDEHTVPDISVGQHWGRFWDTNNLARTCGDRIKYEHNYPDYFPQAAANPQHPWAYPNSALGLFKQWMLGEYLPRHFPKYLDGKVLKGDVAPGTAKLVKGALAPATIVASAPKALPVPPGSRR